MSTATEIARLSSARDTIRDKLIDFGLATSTDKLDVLAGEIDDIVNRGAVQATVQEGDTYTIPVGYHNGSGTVTGVSGGGNYTLQSKEITPTKSQQSVTPDNGYYGLSAVTVNAIPEAYQNVSSVTATAGDVLSPKIIVDSTGTAITGSMPNNGAVSRTLDATTNNQSYTVPAGYHNGSGTVSITLESKSATPTKSSQSITPTTGKVLGSVTVNAIPAAYQDVSNVDAAAGDVLYGKIIVNSSGTEVTGTMPSNGSLGTNVLDATTDNQSFTIPAGHTSGGSVSIVLEEKSATPSASSQNVTPTTGKVLSKVTVAAIPSNWGDTTNDDAIAANILYGKKAHSNSSGSAVQLTGTMPNNGAVSQVLDATTSNQSYSVPAGYHNGSGTVSIVLEEKSATPSASSQNVTPTSGKVLSKVTVAAIPGNWADTTGDDGVAANVLAGVKVHSNLNGAAVAITGSMVNNGAISGTIDGLTTTSYSISAGYTSGGSVSLTNDIELALAAI